MNANLTTTIKQIAGMTLIAALMMIATPAFAQRGVASTDMNDEGSTEPYSPALVSYRIGYYRQLQGDDVRAVEEFSKAIEVLPSFANAYAARGDSYYAMGEYDSAIADYTFAVSKFPDFVSVLYMRGRAYDAMGQSELALADYQNAINQMPEYAQPYLGAGDLYFAQGDTTTALSFYREYVERSGETPDALVMARIGELEAAA